MTEDSMWVQNDMDTKMRFLLQSFRMTKPHHFGNPFVSPYQLAIAFSKEFPEMFSALNIKIGGAGIGEHNSLAQYIARMLSRRISSGAIADIEGAWLHARYVQDLVFSDSGHPVRATGFKEVALSMFRLKD